VGRTVHKRSVLSVQGKHRKEARKHQEDRVGREGQGLQVKSQVRANSKCRASGQVPSWVQCSGLSWVHCRGPGAICLHIWISKCPSQLAGGPTQTKRSWVLHDIPRCSLCLSSLPKAQSSSETRKGWLPASQHWLQSPGVWDNWSHLGPQSRGPNGKPLRPKPKSNTTAWVQQQSLPLVP
jgi:hypothetical protein